MNSYYLCLSLLSLILFSEYKGMKFVWFSLSSLNSWDQLLSRVRGHLPGAAGRDVLPLAVGGPKTGQQPRMAEVVLSQEQCISCRSAFCGPACRGTGGHLRRWHHGHIRGLSSLQDGLEGCCPFGAGQVGITLDIPGAVLH